MLILVLILTLIFIYILCFKKVKIDILFKLNYIDEFEIKFILKIGNVIIYIYKLYIRSCINYYINNREKKKTKKSNLKDKAIKYSINDILSNNTNIKIVVGSNNIIITNYIVVIITTVISIICGKYIKRKNIKNVKYSVLPNYENVCIIFESMLKIKVITLIIFLIMLNKKKSGGYVNGRTSN